MRFISQDALNVAVLFKLFVHAQTADDRLDKNEIAVSFDIKVSTTRIDLALKYLEDKGYIEKYISSGKSTISLDGYKFIEDQISRVSSFSSQYSNGGDTWLEKQTVSLDGIPAADRIVSRSDNEPKINSINDTLAELRKEVETSNSVGESLGAEKELILGELQSSQILTRQSTFRISRLISLISPALRFLAEKFSGSAVGEAAKRLMQLIFELL